MVNPDTGEVDREAVFSVLRHYKVDLSPDPMQGGNTLMVRGEVALSLPFDPWVRRRTLQLLKRRFSIPIHHFYRPEMMAFETLESPERPS